MEESLMTIGKDVKPCITGKPIGFNYLEFTDKDDLEEKLKEMLNEIVQTKIKYRGEIINEII